MYSFSVFSLISGILCFSNCNFTSHSSSLLQMCSLTFHLSAGPCVERPHSWNWLNFRESKRGQFFKWKLSGNATQLRDHRRVKRGRHPIHLHTDKKVTTIIMPQICRYSPNITNILMGFPPSGKVQLKTRICLITCTNKTSYLKIVKHLWECYLGAYELMEKFRHLFGLCNEH